MYAFEKLEVWQSSKELVLDIYRLSKLFPPEEKFGLSSQLRRAAISISSNLAEGSSRPTGKDQAHYSSIAYGSLMETLNQLIISNELEYITKTDLLMLRAQIHKISNQINALRRWQLNK
ncbi:four helix bundle protein [Sediminicola luteus]|uniref:Four helix bundle protein n=1 Tax=Sediminicola luteus TaxID=319238 RepID=A0A2A4GEA2_9FLAO|nr:four helix bundle protein [Sediminicola luteus]PCE66741.1 four helix bundle protein [Sediminicola luteus]